MNNTEYLAALPPTVQAALTSLVRAAAALSIDEKDQASSLALDVAKRVLAEDPDAQVALPFGLLAGVVHEVWARSISFTAAIDVEEVLDA